MTKGAGGCNVCMLDPLGRILAAPVKIFKPSRAPACPMKVCHRCKHQNLFLRMSCELCNHDLQIDSKVTRQQGSETLNPLQDMIENRGFKEVCYSFHFWDALMAAEPILASA